MFKGVSMNCKIRTTIEAQELDIDKSNTTESIGFKLPSEAIGIAVRIGIKEGFDGTATLSIGTSADKTKFANEQSLATAGAVLKTIFHEAPKMGEAIYVKVNGTPTAGSATLFLEYYTKNTYTAQY